MTAAGRTAPYAAATECRNEVVPVCGAPVRQWVVKAYSTYYDFEAPARRAACGRFAIFYGFWCSDP